MGIHTRFVIFGQGRTGSKLLVELLRSHPKIQCDGEILHAYFWNKLSRRLILPFYRLYPLPFFRQQASKSQKTVYGFKLFYGQVQWPGHLLTQMHNDDWSIVHIQRLNITDQVISGIVAHQTGRWHRRYDHPATSMMFTIDPTVFRTAVQRQMNESAQINRLLTNIPHLDIVYEDDLARKECWASTSDRLLKFLGMPPLALTCDLGKTWEKPYSELITNCVELVAIAQEI